MNYFETELIFESLAPNKKANQKSFNSETFEATSLDTPIEVTGINLRLGNNPIVVDLKQHLGVNDAPNIGLKQDKDYYLIIHAISAVRTKGKAKVDELCYSAICENSFLQTIDLIPSTRFKEVFKIESNPVLKLSCEGEISASIPDAWKSIIATNAIHLGGGVKLEIINESQISARLTYPIHFPVVQASGFASHRCAWILHPDEAKTPLLGDQLLIQSIAIPSGTNSITYQLLGRIKVTKGLFWKQQEKATPVFKVNVQLK
jgi:hypothetical protein